VPQREDTDHLRQAKRIVRVHGGAGVCVEPLAQTVEDGGGRRLFEAFAGSAAQ